MRNCRVTPVLLGLVLNVAVVVGICTLRPVMMPYLPGNADDFWNVALRVDLHPRSEHDRMVGHIHLGEAWFYYEDMHMHGSTLYRISKTEVMSCFPDVLQILDAMALDPDQQTDVTRGYRERLSSPELSTGGLKALLEAVDLERTKRVPWAHDAWVYGEVALEERIQKLSYLPACIIFEFLHLSALIWFVLWPVARRKPFWKVALRITVAPLLFFLPAYLGYSQWSFTSIGPSGGVLYPWLLVYVRGGSMLNVEQAILERVPQFLEPMSQDFGMPMVLSGMGMCGPTSLLGYGAFSAVIMLLTPWVWRKCKRRFGDFVVP